MSSDREQKLAEMHATALAGGVTTLAAMVETGQDVAVLKQLLGKLFNHLDFMRGHRGIDKYLVRPSLKRSEVPLVIPDLGRENCTDLGRTYLVAGPWRHPLQSSPRFGEVYIFLCANRHWLLLSAGSQIFEYENVDTLLRVLSPMDDLRVRRYTRPGLVQPRGTGRDQLRTGDFPFGEYTWEPLVSPAWELLIGIETVLEESNRLRDADSKRAHSLQAVFSKARLHVQL